MIYVDIGENVFNVIFKYIIIDLSINFVLTLINTNFPHHVTYELNGIYIKCGDYLDIIQPTTCEYYAGYITQIDNNLITMNVVACPYWNSDNMMGKDCVFDMRYFREFRKSDAHLISG